MLQSQCLDIYLFSLTAYPYRLSLLLGLQKSKYTAEVSTNRLQLPTHQPATPHQKYTYRELRLHLFLVLLGTSPIPGYYLLLFHAVISDRFERGCRTVAPLDGFAECIEPQLLRTYTLALDVDFDRFFELPLAFVSVLLRDGEVFLKLRETPFELGAIDCREEE